MKSMQEIVSTSKPKLLIFESRVSNIITHRKPIVEAAVKSGFEVHVTTLVHQDPSVLDELPLTYHRIGPGIRGGGIKEFLLIYRFRMLVRKIKPDLCHFMSLRAVLFGLIAVPLSICRQTVSSITGLGFLFIDGSLLSRVSRRLLGVLIWAATLRGNHHFVFQNLDDEAALRKVGCLSNTKPVLIRGSGVDLEQFPFSSVPPSSKIVLFPARYLTHKGIVEFADAAAIVNERLPDVAFQLAGGLDPNNPACVETEWLNKIIESGIVSDLGYQEDMMDCLTRATIVCLPSYREGLPKALLEAAAVGRPLVACDVPGCREVIIDGWNGALVPVLSAPAIADAIIALFDDNDKLTQMGINSRRMVEQSFSATVVQKQFLNLYEKIGGKSYE